MGFLFQVFTSNARKYEKVRRALPLDDKILESSGDNPREDMEKTEEIRTVAEAISTLPEKQKIALALRYYENRSYTEIAEILGCSSGAAKKHVKRAKLNLRKSIGHVLRER